MKARYARRRHTVVPPRGLGEDDRTRFTQAGRRRRVVWHWQEWHRGRAERHRYALGGDVVLHGYRHAVERAYRCALLPAFRRGGGLLARTSRVVGVKRVRRGK